MHHSRELMCSAILVQAALLSGCAMQPSAQMAPAALADASTPAQQKVCRDTMVTGSMGFRYICHTQAEWDRLAGRDDDAVKTAPLPSTFQTHNSAPIKQ